MPCEHCGGTIDWIPFNCKHCGKLLCGDCRLPEEHGCQPNFIDWGKYEYKKARFPKHSNKKKRIRA